MRVYRGLCVFVFLCNHFLSPVGHINWVSSPHFQRDQALMVCVCVCSKCWLKSCGLAGFWFGCEPQQDGICLFPKPSPAPLLLPLSAPPPTAGVLTLVELQLFISRLNGAQTTTTSAHKHTCLLGRAHRLTHQRHLWVFPPPVLPLFLSFHFNLCFCLFIAGFLLRRLFLSLCIFLKNVLWEFYYSKQLCAKLKETYCPLLCCSAFSARSHSINLCLKFSQ